MSNRDTRKAILDAAQELVQRIGSNAMSYEHISKVVGIRKASIHYYFQTKEDLIQALLARYSAHFLGLVDEIICGEGNASRKMEKYVELFEATLGVKNREKACLCGMLGVELATLGASSARQIRNFYEANESKLAKILKEGKKDGSFHFKGSPEATAALIFSLLEGAVLISRAQGGTTHFRTIGSQLGMLLRG